MPALPPITALTFDFADTLFPHRPREIETILQAVAAYLKSELPPFAFSEFYTVYLEIRDKQFRENRADLRENDFEGRLRQTIARIAPARDMSRDEEWVQGCVNAYADAFFRAMVMPPYLPALFARLSQKYKIAVISNYPVSEPIIRTLTRDGLMSYLAGVVVSADLGVIKPHPRLFEAALEVLGNPAPETVLHIGDDWDADILGAGRLGFSTIYTTQWRDIPDTHYQTGDFAPLREISDLCKLLDVL